MDPIQEKELVVAGKERAIDSLRVQQLDDGRFSVIVKLNWRANEVVLVTQRKNIRGWVNLDRLLAHIRDNYGITSQINITLKGESS